MSLDQPFPPMACNRAIFLPSAESSLKEMLYIAQCLERRGTLVPSFVIRTPMREHWLDEIRKAGHELIVTPAAQRAIVDPELPAQGDSAKPVDPTLDAVGPAIVARLLAAPRRVLRWVGNRLMLDSLSRYARAMRRFRTDCRQASRLLDQLVPALLVTPSDRTIGLETALLAEGRRRGIPSLVIPWCLWTPRSEVYARMERSNIEQAVNLARLLNRRVAHRFPGQVLEQDEHRLLFAPGETILAANRMGILPPRPFAFFGGGGLADRVAVESPALRAVCLQRGVPATNVRLTGRASADQVAARLRQGPRYRAQLQMEFGLRPHLKTILCAVPNTAEQNLCSWTQHEQDTHRLFQAMRSAGACNVLLNLHPKSNPGTYRAIAEQYRFTIAEGRAIEELLPACDLFVSTFSSTIVTAIGCHKPVLNLDIYGARDDMFGRCQGVVTVRDWDAAAVELRSLIRDEVRFQRLLEAQQVDASHWGMFDGHCGARLMVEMENLVRNRLAARREAA